MSSKGVSKVTGRSHAKLVDQPVLLATTTGIDAAAIANHAIYTAPAGALTTIRMVVVRCTAASGITAAAIAGVGVTADEIYAFEQLIGLTSSGLRWIFPSGQGTSPLVLAGETLMLRISTAAVGTSKTVEVDVFGHEL